MPQINRLDGACFAKYRPPVNVARQKKTRSIGYMTESPQPVFIIRKARSRMERAKIRVEKRIPLSR